MCILLRCIWKNTQDISSGTGPKNKHKKKTYIQNPFLEIPLCAPLR